MLTSLLFSIILVHFAFCADFPFSKVKKRNAGLRNGREPVFVHPVGPEVGVILSRSDFQLARYFPVPDQPFLPKIIRKDLIEGDIFGFTREEYKRFIEEVNHAFLVARDGIILSSAVRDPLKRWENGQVPYKLSSHYTQDARTKIAEVFKEFEENTCVRFVPRVNQNDYIHIRPMGDYDCYSHIGIRGGEQTISLGKYCFQKGTIIHELMHVLGFFHEQSRNDRDQYIKVVWENLDPGAIFNFEKYPLHRIDHLRTTYDYGSVMHYGKKYFSRNKKDTIIPLKPGVKIGQRDGFSEIDLERINRLYECCCYKK